jgi:MFS family permease
LLAVNWSAFALSFVARGVVTATLALFLQQAFGDHFGPGGAIGVATLASWLIGVRWMAEIGLATPLGALSDRVGRARSAVVWAAAAAVAVLGLAMAPAVGVVMAASVLLFVASSGLGSTLDAAAGDLAPSQRRAQVMSAYADWSDIGAALGPLLALTFAGTLGLRPSYALGALLLASGAAAVAIAFRRSTTAERHTRAPHGIA